MVYSSLRSSFSDTLLLQVPWFSGDHWAMTIELKCRDLFESGSAPLQPESIVEEDSVSNSLRTNNSHLENRSRSHGLVKGTLLTTMYHILKVMSFSG